MNRSFSKDLTSGNAQWVQLLDFDAAGRTVVLGLSDDPGRKKTPKLVKFFDVTNFAESWHSADIAAIEGLLDATTASLGEMRECVLYTDQREISFLATRYEMSSHE